MAWLVTVVRFAVVLALLPLAAGCRPSSPSATDRVKISYWEKWTGFEGEAIAAVVKAFNEKPEREKDRIEVELTTVSQIERKLLVATAGGDPPDVAGIYTFILYSYAEKGALTDLTPLLGRAGITRADYVPVYWDMCEYRGRMWALPTTPATIALHWNKRLFREAGLDPNMPPKTIRELDEMAEKLTVWQRGDETCRGAEPEGTGWKLAQIGFVPQEPGWWAWSFGFWFGGKLWDGKDRMTVDMPENLAAYEWVQSYTRKYGKEHLQKFASGFGNFSSPQNAFLSGKVAMEIQGVWMHNFIEKYAPGMEWAAAPFPAVDTSMPPVSNVEADVIVIPKGSKHPREAFKFIQYLSSQEGMEILCSGHRKFSPLAKVSPGFLAMNPPANPYLDLFRDLSYSPGGFSIPKLGLWNEYRRELGVVFDDIRFLNRTAPEALGGLQARMQGKLDKELRQRELRRDRGT
jgi:ABC-type glycerol-3-phosphate transport system substrate-binding protein